MLFVIAKFVAIALALYFAFATDAASGWKVVVVALIFLSLFLQHTLSSSPAYFAGLAIQGFVSVAVLTYLKIRD